MLSEVKINTNNLNKFLPEQSASTHRSKLGQDNQGGDVS